MLELEHLDRAVPLLEASLAAAREGHTSLSCSVSELALRLSECLRRLGRVDEALQADRRAERALRDEGNLPELARCLLRIIDDLMARHDAVAAEACALEAVELAAKIGDRLLRARANHARAIALQTLTRHAEALEAFGASLTAAREPEPLPGWKVDASILGTCRSLAASGESASAAELLQTLADEACDAGELRRAESLHAECAQMLQRAGDVRGAAYAGAERCASLAGSAQPLNAWRLAQADCLERLGERDEALQTLEASLESIGASAGAGARTVPAANACRTLQATQPALVAAWASTLFGRLKSAAASGGDHVDVAIGLLALFTRAGEALRTEPASITDAVMQRQLLQALSLLERADRKHRLPEAMPRAEVAGLLADGWALAAELLQAAGDTLNAAGARDSAAQWKHPKEPA
jgi:tetratricopeptide (TPR) repeat protein